jgi:hypothetical protein
MPDNKNNQQDSLTLESYILNPMGKNNAVLNAATREMMKKIYMNKFDNLMVREKGRMEYHLYTDQKKNQYWAHIKIPSETVEKFYYDIVFKFYNSAENSSQKDLFKWNVQFFSNDPAFVYTYAHTFINKNYFIKELSSKMSKEAIKSEAKEKNPNDNVGYVKTIYFAYLFLQNRNFNKIGRFENEATPLIAKELLSNVMPADEKINLRQEEGRHVSKRKKKTLTQDQLRNIKKVTGNNLNLGGRVNVTTTNRIKTIKSSINTKGVKTTKRK